MSVLNTIKEKISLKPVEAIKEIKYSAGEGINIDKNVISV